MRKLATIQRIEEVLPIPNADAIEKIRVRDWWCVAKKGEFVPGSVCAYFEIDSLLPALNPVFDFLAKGSRVVTVATDTGNVSGYRLKTVKLRGQISQGLALPIQAFGLDAVGCSVGDDVSGMIGVVQWEPPISKQVASFARGPFPSFIPKTDEERVQNLRGEIEANAGRTCYVTEKLDGTSATFYRSEDGEFHACSRNLDLQDGGMYWEVARQYRLVDAMGHGLAIQGEIVGEGIQGNHYGVRGKGLFVFNIYDFLKGEYQSNTEMLLTCDRLGLTTVPMIDYKFILDANIQGIIDMADGKSVLNLAKDREGLVFRTTINPRLSFKAISNRYLLKEKETSEATA
jgi:RNA ligase (TIGR02306 family)